MDKRLFFRSLLIDLYPLLFLFFNKLQTTEIHSFTIVLTIFCGFKGNKNVHGFNDLSKSTFYSTNPPYFCSVWHFRHGTKSKTKTKTESKWDRVRETHKIVGHSNVFVPDQPLKNKTRPAKGNRKRQMVGRRMRWKMWGERIEKIEKNQADGWNFILLAWQKCECVILWQGA